MYVCNMCMRMSGMILTGKTNGLCEKPIPVPISAPKISQGLTPYIKVKIHPNNS